MEVKVSVDSKVKEVRRSLGVGCRRWGYLGILVGGGNCLFDIEVFDEWIVIESGSGKLFEGMSI